MTPLVVGSCVLALTPPSAYGTIALGLRVLVMHVPASDPRASYEHTDGSGGVSHNC